MLRELSYKIQGNRPVRIFHLWFFHMQYITITEAVNGPTYYFVIFLYDKKFYFMCFMCFLTSYLHQCNETPTAHFDYHKLIVSLSRVVIKNCCFSWDNEIRSKFNLPSKVSDVFSLVLHDFSSWAPLFFKAAQSNISNMVVLNKWVLTKYEVSSTDNITLIQFTIQSKLIKNKV